MNKAFNNFAWKNYPDTGTPLEKSVLDKINNGLDEVDNRVVTYDTTKFDTAQAQLLVKNVELNENSGVLKVTYYNGSVSTYSSLLGKVAVNFDFNEESQKMIIYLSNGKEKEVDLSSFIMEYEFLESDSIYFTIDENSKIAFEQRAESLTIGQHIRGVLEEDGGKYKHIIVESEVEISEIHGVYYDAVGEGDNIVFKRNISDPRHFISAYCPGGIAQFNIYVEVNSDAEDYGANKKVIAYLQKKGTVSAHIKEGSIQEKHLRPDYLANIKAEVSKAEAVSGYAATAATTAGNNATLSKSWAVGDTNTRPGENTDNSKYYYQQSKSIYDNFSQAGTVTGVKGNAENAYRTGNVNITAENVGALPATKEGSFFQKLNLEVEGYSYPSNCIYTQGLDLNQVSESGLYFCSSPVNAPSSSSNGNGFMIAITYAGKTRGMQIYMPVSENMIYKRQNTNNTWGSWEKIKAGSAETAVNKGGDTIPGRLNFIRDSAIRFITPGDVTGGHARGIYFLDKNGTDIWGGIGAIGNGGILEGIYLGIGSTYPWSPSNSLYITDSSIKWKNSNLVTENSGIAKEATKATQDGNGNVIADTYLPISGGTITGNLRLKGSGNYGNTLNFGDGDYVHISEPTDDHLEIKGSEINFVTPYTGNEKFTLNGKKIALAEDIPNIQHGTKSISLAANTLTEFSISFEKNFSSIPNVVFTPRHNSKTSTDMHKIKTITTSGFTGQIISSGGGGYAIEWIAIGS